MFFEVIYELREEFESYKYLAFKIVRCENKEIYMIAIVDDIEHLMDESKWSITDKESYDLMRNRFLFYLETRLYVEDDGWGCLSPPLLEEGDEELILDDLKPDTYYRFEVTKKKVKVD